MKTLSVTEAQKQFSQLIVSGERVEITHPKQTAILLAKEDLEKLENDLLMKDMDLALSKPQKRYTTDEVEAILGEALKRKKGK